MKKKNLRYLVLLVPAYLQSIGPKRFIKLFALLCTMIFTNHTFAMEEREKTDIYFSDKNDEDNGYFLWQDEEYFMELIRQIDADAYEKLKRCEQEICQPCIKLNNDINEPMIKIINDKSHGYPVLLINPQLELLSRQTQDVYLALLLKWYSKAEKLNLLLQRNELLQWT